MQGTFRVGEEQLKKFKYSKKGKIPWEPHPPI